MRLHGSHTSPFVRKCLVLLHETGQIDSIELVQTGGTPLDSSAMPLAQNPLGKIPVRGAAAAGCEAVRDSCGGRRSRSQYQSVLRLLEHR